MINHTDIYDGKIANCCQNVRGNKTNKTKMATQTNKQTKQKTKQQQQQQNWRRGAGVEKVNN